MQRKPIKAAQTDSIQNGRLQIHVTSNAGLFPIQDATIKIAFTADPQSILEELTTNESGQTPVIDLPAPPYEYSQNPQEPRPYEDYTLICETPGYEPVRVSGTQLLPDVTAIQRIRLNPADASGRDPNIVIPDHTLYGEYPPKIQESEVKSVQETGEIVLSQVVIPEYIVVHDGPPSDSSAPNYYVKYKDYIKNVVSSEIYATWPESAIIANTLVIQSFTLNRVYTEWYRNK